MSSQYDPNFLGLSSWGFDPTSSFTKRMPTMSQWGMPTTSSALSSAGTAPITMPGMAQIPALSTTPLTENTSWWDMAFGKRNADGSQSMGAVQPAIAGLQTLGNLWLGMKQYGLAKEQLSFQKDSFNKNFTNQVSTLNNSMADRQAARVASNPNAYQSVSSYMAQHGLKG